MAKFIIRWDAGCGESCEVVEADSLEEAEALAYEQWMEEAETQAQYSAVPYTKETAEELSLGD